MSDLETRIAGVVGDESPPTHMVINRSRRPDEEHQPGDEVEVIPLGPPVRHDPVRGFRIELDFERGSK